jgi:hypothetical protein
MTTGEVAEYAGLSEQTLQIMRALDVGPCGYKLVGQWVYRRREVDEWLSDASCERHDPMIAVNNLVTAIREVTQATARRRTL